MVAGSRVCELLATELDRKCSGVELRSTVFRSVALLRREKCSAPVKSVLSQSKMLGSGRMSVGRVYLVRPALVGESEQ